MSRMRIHLGIGIFISLGLLACGVDGNSHEAANDPGKKEKLICGVDKDDLADEPARLEPVASVDPSFSPKATYVTPTRLVPVSQWPRLADDLDFEGLGLAVQRQLERYKSKNLSGTIKLGGQVYPLKAVPESLSRFLEISEDYQVCMAGGKIKPKSCEDRLNQTVQREFNLYAPNLTPDDPRYGEEKSTLFTAYYTPLLRGRTVPDARYKYGVYRKPSSSSLAGKTRYQIDFQDAFKGKGLQLFYSDNLFDLYLLHVQGGGKVVMENKSGKLSSFYISFEGTNGKNFTFISKYMQQKGYISDLSVESQRTFLETHPQKQAEIFATCPGYIYFKQSAHPPLGNDVVPLTDNRSIATDTKYYSFKGLLAFVAAERPREDQKKNECGQAEFQSFSRFFLDQDTGGAIRGKARVDLYFGEGPYAEYAAYNTTNRGDLYFLMLK